MIVPFCHCDNTCAHCRAGVHVGLRQPRLHHRADRGSTPGSPRPTAASVGAPDGMPDAELHPVAAGPLRRDGRPAGTAPSPPACSPGTPSSWSATARSACAACSPRPRWAPSASSRCRATSPARRSPARSGRPTSSTSAARRASARIAELTDGVGADAVLECVGTDGAMQQAFAVARPGSTVGFVGVPHGVELPVRRMFQQERRPRRRDGSGASLPARPARAGAVGCDRPRAGLRPDAAARRGRPRATGRWTSGARSRSPPALTAPDDRLVLGPLLRYVDETRRRSGSRRRDTAPVTVTSRAAAGRAPGRSPCTATTTRWSSSTGSSPAPSTPYAVAIDGDARSGRPTGLAVPGPR